MSQGVPKPVEVYQIKVTLSDSQPPIWRRFHVRSDVTLDEFHGVLQTVMGWKDTHLHEFVIQGQYYGVLEEGDVDVRKTLDESKHRLDDVVSGDCRFTYEYDVGDNWEHVLLVEKILPPQEGASYPVCLAGARASPPEDVGGMPGYESFLQAIRDPKHPEHKEFLEWIGGGFDPEKFDLAEVNRMLRALR